MERGWHAALCMAAAVFRHSGRLDTKSAKTLLDSNKIDASTVELAVEGPPAQGFDSLAAILCAALASANQQESHLREGRQVVASRESLFTRTQGAIETAIEGTVFQAKFKDKGKRRMYHPSSSYKFGDK